MIKVIRIMIMIRMIIIEEIFYITLSNINIINYVKFIEQKFLRIFH